MNPKISLTKAELQVLHLLVERQIRATQTAKDLEKHQKTFVSEHLGVLLRKLEAFLPQEKQRLRLVFDADTTNPTKH